MDLNKITNDPVTILMVDDEQSNLLLMEEALAGLGTLISTTDPLDALSLAFEHQPQITILDVDMPNMNGHELCRHLLNNPHTANTSVMFVTSHTETSVEHASLSCAAVDFITKPIDLNLCRLRVNNQLQLRLKSDALAVAKKEMQDLLAQIPVFVSYWSLDWQLRFCNDYSGDWFGFSCLDKQSQALSALMPDKLVKDIEMHCQSSSDIEFRYEDKQSVARRFYHIHVTRRTENNTPIGYLLTAVDITHIIKAKQALREEKEWLKVTLDSIGDAVIATDIEERITFMNPISERMTGWSFSDAKGLSIEQVMNLSDATTGHKSISPIHMALKEKRTVAMALNCQLTSLSGQTYRVEDSAAPIRDAKGNVIGAIIVFHDVSETVAMSVKMSHLANHDPLTDLPNRVLLHDRITNNIRVAQTQHHRVAMFLIDIDNFKYINDAQGHHVGDLLIKQIAQRLLQFCLPGYTLARAGGDEFVILIDNIHHVGLVDSMATEVLLAIQKPFQIENREIKVTASMGVSLFPDDANSEEKLLRYADTAMYRAKQQGKNHHCFFSQELESELLNRHQIELLLRHALEENALEVHLQPQYELPSGKLCSCEALVRLRDPLSKKLISPIEFIPIAEDCGLINQLGHQVLEKSCTMAKQLLVEGYPMRIAVNVAAKQFTNSHFVQEVQQTLASLNLPSEYLELEVTESALMNDFMETQAMLTKLKSLGISIAIDDFGTGYSSLSYLKSFPIDILKVDRSFVSDMTKDNQSLNIVKTIIHLAQSLDLHIIAEGIETQEEKEMLHQLGCQMGQGYWYSKPVPFDEFKQLLRNTAKK
ncbi:EAL domain-containing protein [Vibrio viridaestus]|uniref:EAL domain-containing protein n=1 Tax=Vibrio viridaestus TaxID=2487322 RepID=A0A3N9U0B5_9VIBR|nr:EAL domain-containing protein [Vibrio viridaestus]RQW61086.1 EAL domain-containing protein [Vibrio viridaestus]